MFDPTTAGIRTIRVLPSLPAPLAPMLDLAHNLWWTWQPVVASLFQQLDPELWETTGHNPVKLLGSIAQDTLNRAAADPAFVHAVERAAAELNLHISRTAWFHDRHGELPCQECACPVIAYFSAEFGLTESFQIYSGGLGCLAGDHLKSASELGVPLIAVGLLYRQGYFHQYLNTDGWQQETYPDIDLPNQPARRIIDPETGRQRVVWIDLPGRRLAVGAWECKVGRVTLYLLDTNLEENNREDRDITRRLYGGDVERRIQQELVLGVAGVRFLDAVGVHPAVYHMNEGHSAFLALEHIRLLRDKTDLTFPEALQATAAAHLFTTHTPVPAGIDRFAPDLVERYLSPMCHGLGVSMHDLLALGRENPADDREFFSMAVLALKTSNRCNGVSRLHGEVSRNMWTRLWPGLPIEETPIGHVTNGVHTRSWVAPGLKDLFDRYLGWAWQRDPADHAVWADAETIPDEELWRVHNDERADLIAWTRRRIRTQLGRRGLGRDEIEHAAAALDPNILTVGFARRFATYKRATLLLSDPERLTALLGDRERPIQILIAGKSHPADGPGKEMIREVAKFAERAGRSARVVFLEDYDIEVGRRLVSGCDIWLNTPRRGLEASGTSGMKAGMNGVINVSILDGWWDEGYEREIGFAIGRGESYEDPETQDKVEGRAIYDLFERHIIPEFYQRDPSGLPRAWIARMKRSIMSVAPFFNTNRMVAEYAERWYIPAATAHARLAEDNHAGARALTSQLERYRAHWREIAVESVTASVGSSLGIGKIAPVRAVVRLGTLNPDEVAVQLYAGLVHGPSEISDARISDLAHTASLGDGRHEFAGELLADRSGRMGFTIRVQPRHDLLDHPCIPGLITWHAAPNSDLAHESATLTVARA